MFTRKISLSFILLGLVLLTLNACAGAVPDASKSTSRDVINSGGIVQADQLRVAE